MMLEVGGLSLLAHPFALSLLARIVALRIVPFAVPFELPREAAWLRFQVSFDGLYITLGLIYCCSLHGWIQFIFCLLSSSLKGWFHFWTRYFVGVPSCAFSDSHLQTDSIKIPRSMYIVRRPSMSITFHTDLSY